MSEIELDLLHRYLDGVITAKELEQLEDLLRSSAEARATLRSLATIDGKWHQLASDGLIFDPTDGANHSPSTIRAIPLWLTISVIAASLVFGVFGWFRASQEQTAQVGQGIARVIRVEGEGKVGQNSVVVGGAELFAGEELNLSQGLIELAFRETGVHIIATAPLRLMLDSDQQVSLYEGQTKLVVPPHGVGFVVKTAQRKFVDLGTSFVVTAGANGSEVLVLDGQISVDDHGGTSNDLMHEGEFARFDLKGILRKRSPFRLSRSLPELSLAVTDPSDGSLPGVILGYDSAAPIAKKMINLDVIGHDLLPLIDSEFQDRACLAGLKQGEPLCFRGIAGAFHEFPARSGLVPYSHKGGWMAWYHGPVLPPSPGRYRFWGYADNHLLVAIDGQPVFEGSRRESPFKTLGIARTDNPSLPCLIAPAGFACSDWIELSGDPVQLDILFGEVGGKITSGLLLVECEGDSYEETFWGQPKWPLLLTENPAAEEIKELELLVDHLEEKTMGSFSISEQAMWKVQDIPTRSD